MIRCCVLKGKTTSDEQFAEFLDSYFEALDYRFSHYPRLSNPSIRTMFMIDTDVSMNNAKSKVVEFNPYERRRTDPRMSFEFDFMSRDDDPGFLRNEFMAWVTSEYTDEEAEDNNVVFTFFDGDDWISKNYFDFDESKIKGRGFALMDPFSVYGTEKTNYYPSKWCQNANNHNIFDLALIDMVGGQCWGKIWDYPIAKTCQFGRGLYEDVPFWYRAVEQYRNPVLLWNHTYFWRRTNPNALTRNTPSIYSIQDGIDNLNWATEIATKHYPKTDRKVWKRYTAGIVTLARNACKTSDKANLLDYLAERINKEIYKPVQVSKSDPKLFETVLKSFPEFWDWEPNKA